MRSLSMLFGLVHDLERLAMTPFYRRPSMFLDQWPTLSPSSQLLRNSGIGAQKAEPKTEAKVTTKDDFRVRIDVAQFKPEELKVKLVENWVEIEGKQEERDDGRNYVASHHFVRRFTLPSGCDADQVVSTLSPDGVLTVSVPRPQIEQRKPDERVVEIRQIDSNQVADEGAKGGNGDPKK